MSNFINNSKNNIKKEEFYNWFIGFVEGEGSFNVSLSMKNNKLTMTFTFAIELHIDDANILYKIKSFLPKGRSWEYIYI